MNFKKVSIVILLTVLTLVTVVALLHMTIINFIVNNELEKRGLPLSLHIESLNTEYTHVSNIKIGSGTMVESLKLGYQLKPHFRLKTFDVNVSQYDVEELKKLEFPTDSEKSDRTEFKFDHCDTIEQTQFQIDVVGLKSTTIKIECEENNIKTKVQDIYYEDMGPFGLELTTRFKGSELLNDYHVFLEATPISRGSLNYSMDTNKIIVQSQELKKSLQLSQLIKKLAPQDIKSQIVSSSGSLNYKGTYAVAGEQANIDFELKANNIAIETENIKTKAVYLNHSIVEYPSLKSKKKQSLRAKEITVGATIKDLKVIYDVISKENLYVHSLDFEFDGAKVKARKFKVFPFKKRISPTQINIQNQNLEKFLRLALGETANATGKLTGEVKLKFKNNKPVIESGTLKAIGPGNIQYRPPNSKGPPDPNSFSTDPMEILNNYLYDFHYTELSVSMSSDENYDMKMKLTALGKNPNYLNGKALKLNVNLEQNLLAAFQAMMLSYNLPKRLEEKITNLGKQ